MLFIRHTLCLALKVASAMLLSVSDGNCQSVVAGPTNIVELQLQKLQKECENPTLTGQSRDYVSVTEWIRHECVTNLKSLGPEIIPEVRKHADDHAVGVYKDMLTIALAALGDDSATTNAAQLMLESTNATIRVCAAFELRKTKNKKLIEPFKKALNDTYKRPSGMDVGSGDRIKLIYPVRIIASDALVELGVPFEEVRKLRGDYEEQDARNR